MCSICAAVASGFMTTITVIRPPNGFVGTRLKRRLDRLWQAEKNEKSPGTLIKVPGPFVCVLGSRVGS